MSRPRRSRTRALVPLTVLALVTGGLLGSSGSARGQPVVSPSRFAVSVVRMLVANRYGEAWALMNGAQRQDVPRALYVDCERREPIPGHLAAVRALGVQRTAVRVPGSAASRPGYAVSVQTTIGGLSGGESVTSELTFYVVTDTGRFSWVLRADRFNAYRAGHCSTGSTPPA